MNGQAATSDKQDGQAQLATSLHACARACAGATTLIHLAATPDDDDFMQRLLPDNIVGFYNIMEAARIAGFSRITFTTQGGKK